MYRSKKLIKPPKAQKENARHIIINMLKTSNKEKILKSTMEG